VITDLGSAGPLDREQHVTLGVTPRADWWKSMGSADIDQLVALRVVQQVQAMTDPTSEVVLPSTR
jgi:hypothetical protein